MSIRKSTSSTPAPSTRKSTKTTRARTTTKRKTSTAAKTASPAAKTVRKTAATATKVATPAPNAVDPMVVSEVKPVVTQETLRKKALLDEVAERSGIKRRDAKAALESALEILGEAIAAGQEINLPGFGKLKVTRTKKLANGQIYMSRIRQPIAQAKPATGAGATVAKDPLAEAAE